MNVLVRKNNQERGPYTESELRERLKSGALSGSDLGQIEGESDWKPLSEILLASVLANGSATAAPPPRPDFTASVPWLRDPKVIAGAVVLLLFVFGGINWLNKASEKRRADAAAARQREMMEQAQKQSEEYSRQQQERAEKARQAQLDQVKQMMGMSEKAQKDYQEKEKQRLAEEEKARKARELEQERKRQETERREEEERQQAEAKQKREQEERIAREQQAAQAAATPNLLKQGKPLWRDPAEAANYVFAIEEIWDVTTNAQVAYSHGGDGTPRLVANQPGLVFFSALERVAAGFTFSTPHLYVLGNKNFYLRPPIGSGSSQQGDAYMASDYRRMALVENGDIWRGEFDWAKGEVVNKKRVTTNGLFAGKKPLLWYGNTIYIDGQFSKEKPIVKVDLVSGALEEIPTYDVFKGREYAADRGMFINPTGDLCFFPHGSVLNTYDARTGKAATVRITAEVKEHGRPVPIDVVTPYSKLTWIDSNTALCTEGEHPLVRVNVRTGASTVLDDRPGQFEEVSLLPGGHFADVLYKPREVYGKKLPAERYLIDVTNGMRTKVPYSAEMSKYWLDPDQCIFGKTTGGLNEVGTWLFNRVTGEVKKLCSVPCDGQFAMLPRQKSEVCFSAREKEHLCRVKLTGEDFTELACGRHVRAINTAPIDLGLGPDSKPLWQPASNAPQQQAAESKRQQQVSGAAPQGQAAEATPQQQQVETKLQQASGDKPGDWINVMDAIKNESPEVQAWARMAYDYCVRNTFLNDFYDPAKLTLKFLSAHRQQPDAAITTIVSKTDYKDCVSRTKVEQWAYLRTFQVMKDLPPTQLERAATEVGRLVADAYVANPVPKSGYKERLYNNALTKVRHTLHSTPQNPGGSTPAGLGNESTAVGEAKAAKRATPNPSPLAVAYADPKIEMEDLGPMPKDLKEVAVSADGLHVAAVIPTGDGQVVYYDGKPGPQYDNIAHFMSSRSPAVVFSEDGTHIAYLAVRGDSQFVWADGKETELTSRFLNSGDARRITLGTDAVYFKFSPGGEHLTYACDAGNFHKEIVVDEAQGRAFYDLNPVLFSERGGHYAYVGKPNQSESLVVVDGTPGLAFSDINDASLRLSPDGTHCAYIATKSSGADSWFVVLDGNEQRSYDNIESLQFSSTGHCAYVGMGSLGDGTASGAAVVVDGKEVAQYPDQGRGPSVEQLRFSPDGNHLAYVAKTPDGVAVVVDGKKGHSYDAIGRDSLQFSADSSSLTYYAKTGKDTFVVTDGRESPAVSEVLKFTRAEKANTAAFIAGKEPGFIAIVDNHPSRNYRFCYDVAVSPDGSRYAYAMSASIGHPEVVVDGRAVNLNPASFEDPAWGIDLKTVFRFSPDSRHLAMAGMGPDGIGQIISVDGRAGPRVGWCQRFVFSRDSAHFAYLDLEAGPKGTTTKIMLDHKPVQTFGPQPTMMVFAATRENQAARQLPPRDSRSAPASAALPDWFTFRSDNKLKFLATKDGKIYRVTITPGAPTGGPVIAKTTSEAPVQSGPSSTRPLTSRAKGSSPEKQPAPASTSEPPESQQPVDSISDQPAVQGTADAADAVTASSASGIAESLVQALSGGEVEAVSSLYADTVDYMNSGRITSDAVRSQLQEYFARWPVRQWTMLSPAKVESRGASGQKVIFLAHYDVSDPQTGRHSSGTAEETLMLAPDSTGAMKIISERQETRKDGSREKSGKSNQRRDRREKVYDGRPVIPIPPNIPWPPGLPHP
jgi:hypothetical protein